MSESQSNLSIAPPDPSSEMTLGDLVALVWRRRVLLSTVVVAVEVVVGIYLWRTPKLYEARASIQIGLVSQANEKGVEIEPPAELVSRLHSRYALWDGGREYPRLEKVSRVIRAGPSRNIELFARGESVGAAEAKLQEVVDDVLSNHATIHREAIAAAEQRVGRLNRVLDAALSGSEANAGKKNAVDEVLQFTVPEIANDLYLQEPALAVVRANPSRLVFSVKARSQPVWPRPTLLLAGGLALGMFLGFWLALFAELAGRNRPRG